MGVYDTYLFWLIAIDSVAENSFILHFNTGINSFIDSGRMANANKGASVTSSY